MTPRLRMGTRVRFTQDVWSDQAYDECYPAVDTVASAGDEGIVVDANGMDVVTYQVKLEDTSLHWVHESIIEPV